MKKRLFALIALALMVAAPLSAGRGRYHRRHHRRHRRNKGAFIAGNVLGMFGAALADSSGYAPGYTYWHYRPWGTPFALTHPRFGRYYRYSYPYYPGGLYFHDDYGYFAGEAAMNSFFGLLQAAQARKDYEEVRRLQEQRRRESERLEADNKRLREENERLKRR